MERALAKYKIGLGVIGLFSLALFIVVLMQASATKQDAATFKKATKIADRLNSYVDNNSAPSSLVSLGITDVPDTVSYQRLSGGQYKFCVTYKNDSSGFSAANIQGDLLSAAAGGAGSSGSYSSDSAPASYLYLSSTHHKGKNCQTIKPYDYNSTYQDSQGSSSSSSSSSSTSPANQAAEDACNTKYPASDPTSDKAYYACIDQIYGTPSTSVGQ